MKKKWLFLPVLAIIFTLLPVSFLNAGPGNLVKNGGFAGNSFNNWSSWGNVVVAQEVVTIYSTADISGNSGIYQFIDTTKKNLIFSFDVNPRYSANSGIQIAFDIYKNGVIKSQAFGYFNSLPPVQWTNVSFKVSDFWYDHTSSSFSDFDQIKIIAETYYGCIAQFDNFKLKAPEKKTEAVAAAPVWIRTMPMTCYRVWINEDNNFQFIFVYPYRDNNWVKIYDMSGKEVYSIDMPYDNPNIIVDLPDGMYTVKTFNDQPEPIQTFVIGKP